MRFILMTSFASSDARKVVQQHPQTHFTVYFDETILALSVCVLVFLFACNPIECGRNEKHVLLGRRRHHQQRVTSYYMFFSRIIVHINTH